MNSSKNKLVGSSHNSLFPELLESRRLCSSNINLSGMISISGTQWNDNISVDFVGGSVVVSQNVGGQPVTRQPYDVRKVTYISINGLEGNDLIANNTYFPSEIDGYKGNDIIDGGSGRDYIYGRDGDDSISGRGGDDYIDGAGGNNALYGGDGNDSLISWDGVDTMVGGNGNDYMRSYGGADLLYGGAGNDSLIGGAGNDSLYGENGVDWIWGEDGDDYLVGGTTDSNPDGLIGGNGNDTFATHWIWVGGGAGWRNYTTVYDFQNYNYGWGVDKWVNP